LFNKLQIIKQILGPKQNAGAKDTGATAWAPSNVALVKYWGKRDVELNLPVTSSLSVSLGKKGTETFIQEINSADNFIFNGVPIDLTSKFALRLSNFLNLFRSKNTHYLVRINSNVPVAAGMASSACGFASIVLALNDLYGWQLSKTELSILARLGSGSACRSLWNGFVKWHAGKDANGMDSFAEPLEYTWPELRIGALVLSSKEKPISSTLAMQQTLATSPLYAKWPDQVEKDLASVQIALAQKDFILLGETAEANAIFMHEMMHHANPPISYALPETVAAIAKIIELRRNGTPVYFTQDAGPNLQLLFQSHDVKTILAAFPEVEIIVPFTDQANEELIIVDSNDNEIEIGEKMTTHLQGKLHRAFSVMIYRYKKNKLELLLQQRSSNKYHSANLWSNTCCGHPRPNEKTIEAAKRRLFEEMGIKTELKEVGVFHYQEKLSGTDLIENEIDHVFVGEPIDARINPNPNEVQNYKWIEFSLLEHDLNQNPNKYTVWLSRVLRELSRGSIF